MYAIGMYQRSSIIFCSNLPATLFCSCKKFIFRFADKTEFERNRERKEKREGRLREGARQETNQLVDQVVQGVRRRYKCLVKQSIILILIIDSFFS